MKSFITKTIFYTLFVGLIHVAALFFADGNTDLFYLRVASPKQESMIIGTSTAAQGILPSVLKEETGKQFFNFAFTLFHSPYGPTYLEAIKKKVKVNSSESAVFIVSVDPWSVSSRLVAPDDVEHFRENEFFLSHISSVSSKPNLGYAFQEFDRAWGDIILQNLILGKGKGQMFLHDDGWLEINVDMSKAAKQKRMENKMKEYQGHLDRFNFSPLRFDYLRKTIEFLKTKGRVVIIQMPASANFAKLSGQVLLGFDSEIKKLSKETEVTLLNFRHLNEYAFTDGVHLYKEDAKVFTKVLADTLKKMNIVNYSTQQVN